jgi:hypothetical protein
MRGELPVPVLQRGLDDPTIPARSVVPTFGDTAHRSLFEH